MNWRNIAKVAIQILVAAAPVIIGQLDKKENTKTEKLIK